MNARREAAAAVATLAHWAALDPAMRATYARCTRCGEPATADNPAGGGL